MTGTIIAGRYSMHSASNVYKVPWFSVAGNNCNKFSEGRDAFTVFSSSMDYGGDQSDEVLVRCVERGGPGAGRAVAALFSMYLPRVYSLCRRYFTVREDAEEAASETFLRAFRALSNGRFRGESRFRTWLLRIASNTCIERLRQPRLPTLSLDGLLVDHGEYEASLIAPSRADHDEHVLEAIRCLPDDQSLAITLCDLEGYSAREAAEIMGRGPEAMKSLHYRARRALRDKLA